MTVNSKNRDIITRLVLHINCLKYMYLTLLLGMIVQTKTNQSQFQFSSVQRSHLTALREVSASNSLSPKLAKSVQHQHYYFSPNSINTQSRGKIRRINKMIIKRKML